MLFVTLSEAQARLPELIDQLPPGEELCITRDGKTVAKLLRMRTGAEAKSDGLWEWALVDITDDDPPPEPAG